MTDTNIAPGSKVETGQPGTPSHRTGVVVVVGSAELLARNEEESSALVAWESGEQEWAELSTLRVS
ncbi:MAG: hypothetical protein ABUL60_01915 [Myxococcales bacterium]